MGVCIYIYVSMVALLMTCMYHILAHPSPSLPPSLPRSAFPKKPGAGINKEAVFITLDYVCHLILSFPQFWKYI